MPTAAAIKDKYYHMFRGKGGEGIEESNGSSGDGARPMEGQEALDNLRAHPEWQ